MTFSGKAGIESLIPEKCVKIHPKCTKEVVVFRLTQFNTIYVKFIYSEKATKFCKISIVDLTVTTQDKSVVEISQKFEAFSEYMNFT